MTKILRNLLAAGVVLAALPAVPVPARIAHAVAKVTQAAEAFHERHFLTVEERIAKHNAW